ncbi:glycerophosphodiester phosphodiesterase [Anaeromyxobacter sp. SG26]|uniref:glycerophosphodiester phosphodiesterase n=1 Tax=Anaeromyxobacter sp. SG26 TaxID=2925407 RepID=UPI001F59A80D|nr:glycerophosphodiester phosphodiesterase family protein [Anaeromyxobacter sp. SG26]
MVLIAHRGLSRARPENTLDAFDAAAAAGSLLETDIQTSADGALVLIHDPTTERTTGVAGRVSAMGLGDLRALNASWLFPGYPPTQIPTLDEYLVRYGTRSILIPEIKSADATLVARKITESGAQACTIVQSFEAKHLASARGVQPLLRTMLLSATPVPVTTLVNLGVWAIGLDVRAVTAEYVAQCHAAGVAVAVYTVNDVCLAERVVYDERVDALFTDDTPYIARFLGRVSTSGTIAGVPAQYPASGWRWVRANGSGAVIDGFATFGGVSSTTAEDALIFPGIRTPADAWTVTTTLKVQRAAPDVTRYVGVRFGFPSDADVSIVGSPTTGHGYTFAYRSNGATELVRVDAGIFSVIARGTWDAYAEGALLPLRINVTPAMVSVTRIDTGQTIAAADASKSRRGFFAVIGNGNVPALGATEVTY